MNNVTAAHGKHPRPQPPVNKNEDHLTTKKPRIEKTEKNDLAHQPATQQRVPQLRQWRFEYTENDIPQNERSLNNRVSSIEMPQFPLSSQLPVSSHTYSSIPHPVLPSNATYTVPPLLSHVVWAPVTMAYIPCMMSQYPSPTYPMAQQPFIHPYPPMPCSVSAFPGGYSSTTTSSSANHLENGDSGSAQAPRFDDYEHGNTIPFIEPGTPSKPQNQASSHALDELISQSKISYRRNDYESALGAADIVLQNDPFNLKGLICKSKALHGLGRYDLSLLAAEMVLKLDPNNAMGFICKAEALRALCMYLESLTTINEFLKVKPTSLKGLICKVDVLYYLDRPFEYLQAARDLLQKSSALIKRGRYDESRDAANWVLKTIPEEDATQCDPKILQQYRLIKSLALIYKSEASRHLDKLTESLDCADMALALGIERNRRIALSCKKEALIAIADALIARNKLIEALSHINSVLTFDQHSLRALKRQFKILKAIDNLPAAAAVGAQAIAICNARVEALKNSIASQPGHGQAAYQELLAVQAKWTKMIDQLQKEMEAIQLIENEILALNWIDEGERLRNEESLATS